MKRFECVLENVKIVDVVNDKIVENKIIHINDGIIDFNDKEDVKRIDCKGCYMVPGLINLHVHLFGSGKPSNAANGKGKSQQNLMKFIKTPLGKIVLSYLYKTSLKTTISSGITTVRAVGDLEYQDVKERDKINKGKYLGPRVLASGYAITAPTGHADGTISRSARTKEEFENLVMMNHDHHVDWIKIMITSGVMDAKEDKVDLMMSVDEAKWVVDKAHSLGYKVASHTESSEGVLTALKAGVDSIEHGSEITPEILELYKKNNASLTITISPALPYSLLDSTLTHCNEVQTKIASKVTKSIIDGANDAIKYNIKYGLGTDASCPYVFHYAMWRELDYFIKATKSSNATALKHATIVNAEILGMSEKIGSIEEGKYADMFLVKNNPYENIRTLMSPQMVIKDGYIINKPRIKRFKDFENRLDNLKF